MRFRGVSQTLYLPWIIVSNLLTYDFDCTSLISSTWDRSMDSDSLRFLMSYTKNNMIRELIYCTLSVVGVQWPRISSLVNYTDPLSQFY